MLRSLHCVLSGVIFLLYLVPELLPKPLYRGTGNACSGVDQDQTHG